MRITQAPRIVGKPLEGEQGTPQFDRAELLKLEIQRVLQSLVDSSNDSQVKLEAILNGSSEALAAAQIHPFLLMGA